MKFLVKKILKFIYLKYKFKNKLIFDFSVNINISSNFEGMNKIHPNSNFSGYLGYGSYVGPNCNLNAKIGKYTSIAPFVRTNIGVHPYVGFVSTSPVFYSTSKQKNGDTFTQINRFNEYRYADEVNKYGIIIGNDCWIGEGVFINGGLKIADGAVVLAHSVVTKDIPPYAIVGGVPAKIIKYRFNEETINYLIEFKWWDKPKDWLKKNIDLFQNINELKKQKAI